MSKCWYCNNELTTGDNPNHFGICNKCYDEMFKSGDTIIRSLTDKIAELQKQLEEKEKKIRQFDNEKGMLLNNSMKLLKEKDDKLKSQPAEIVEKIKGQLIKRLNTIAGYGRMTTDELSFLIETEFGSDLDTILKEYQQ